ncbi:MAG: ATP-binding cassette domain-containing protein, partial [Methanomicrobiales archaeon]|nr:ATP-binding cassette domain-containing protein [Methanomicrobiales archaeon]
MITAENLTRVYTMGRVEVHALAGVSLEVGRGEFVGIMGASGSGKSTFLHILGLLDRPTSGRVTIDEVDVLTLSDHQRTLFRLNRLGYVFQDYALIGELTALENVYLTSLVRGVPKEEYLRRSTEIL